MNHIRQLLIGAACLISLSATAQWQWIDKDGRKVFSDRAPPAEVLEKNILKRPVHRGATTGTTDAPANPTIPSSTVASAPQGAASSPKLSGIDKELLERKKKAEEAEAAKRRAAEEKVLKAKIENCAHAKQAKSTVDSGMRLAHTNEKGEREIMNDAARATEGKRIQSIIDTECR